MTCIGERFCRSPVHKATNGAFGDMGCKAAIGMTHVQGIAALAIAAGTQVRFVRVADVEHDLASVCCRRKLPFVLEAAVQRLPTTAFKMDRTFVANQAITVMRDFAAIR